MGLSRRGAAWQLLLQAAENSPMVLGQYGFHHIHHLSARIPNYNLERCHKAEPLFQSVPPITLFSSFKSLTFRLWDEQRQRLVGFGYLKTLRRQQRPVTQW